MHDLKKTGKTIGFLYLIVIVCAGFSQGVVRETVYVAGDAAATSARILDAGSMFSWGLITDLIAFSTDVAISILFYLMFKQVNKPLALIAAAFRLVAHPAIASLNLLNHYAAKYVLTNSGFAAEFQIEQLQQAAMFFMDAHHMGYLIAGVTFGLHCMILGYLIVQSGFIPRLLGFLMIAASFGYLIESFGFILFPELKTQLALVVGVSAALGEVGLCIWLMIKGAKTEKGGLNYETA